MKSNNHKPISLGKAYQILGEKILLKKSSSETKRCRKNLTVKQTKFNTWVVTGGQCSHTVELLLDWPLSTTSPPGVLVCRDHEPEHKPKKPGWACSHVSAVQLMLAKEIMNSSGGRK